MLKIQTIKNHLSIHTLFMTLVLSIFAASLVGIGVQYKAEAASFSMDSYTDNAGGKQAIRVAKANGKNRPAIIFIHGGGWRVDGGEFGPDFQERAAARGFSSFRISYRLMANGVYEQLNDVMRSIKYVRDNASKFGIDPSRVAIWGDSAGGSLTVRAAATGNSGAATAVGWSAPTNAFRDLFNSVPGFIDGLDHSTCIDTSFTNIISDIIPLFQGQEGTIDKIAKGQIPTPDQSLRLATSVFQTAGIALNELPSTYGKIQKSAGEWGIEIQPGSLATGTVPPVDKADEAPISEDQLKDKLKDKSSAQLAELGKAILQVGLSTSKNQLTSEQAQIVNLVQLGFNDVLAAQNANLADSGSAASESVNPQALPASKIADCIQNFVDLSPALFASPRTPPTFLAVAEHEQLVNAQDAYQMRDKLRSMGIRSEALVLPGNLHMGYDKRAEAPSFNFISSILHP